MCAPPTPAVARSGRISRSRAATLPACMSPEASPATKRTSRTDRRGVALDVAHNPQRDFQRPTTRGTTHHERCAAVEYRCEALELELERLTFRRLQCDTLDEVREIRRRPARDERVQIASLLQSKEFAIARSEIEREITTRLEDSHLAESLPRDAARRDVGHSAGVERDACIRN